MKSVVGQTCPDPIRKTELRRAELSLPKRAIQQLHSRFELLLTDISEPEHDYGVAAEERTGDVEGDPDNQESVLSKAGSMFAQDDSRTLAQIPVIQAPRPCRLLPSETTHLTEMAPVFHVDADR